MYYYFKGKAFAQTSTILDTAVTRSRVPFFSSSSLLLYPSVERSEKERDKIMRKEERPVRYRVTGYSNGHY